MKKIAGLIFALVTFITALSVSTAPAFAFDIDMPFRVDGRSVSTLSGAFNAAADAGSVIEQIGNDRTVYSATENIEVTKNVTLMSGKNFSNTARRIEYSGTDKPLFTVRNGGKLTLQYSEIRLVESDIAGNGKLIVVEQGGTLVLDGTDAEPVTFLDSSDSSGLILVKNGGRILFYGAAFEGNQSDGSIKVENGGIVITDLNGDRVIDEADFYQLCRHLESPETCPLPLSPDFNLDGNINQTDVSLLIECLAEKVPSPDAANISGKDVYSATVTPQKSARFCFITGTDGKCSFVLPEGADTKLWYILRDKNGTFADFDYYNSGSTKRDPDKRTFEISAELTADTEYYLEIGTVQDDEITFDMEISLPAPGYECRITGKHVFVEGVCGCGYKCPHEKWTDGVCDTCKYVCRHNGCLCGTCGKKLAADGGYTGSTLSGGSLIVITAVAGIAVGMAVTFFIMKKKPAPADGDEEDDE